MTGKDLLYKYLEYEYEWSPHSEYLSSTIRLQQIEALLNAFGIAKKYANPNSDITSFDSHGEQQTRAEYLHSITDLEYFVGSDFIDDRPEASKKEIINLAMKEVVEPWEHLRDLSGKKVDVGTIFGVLLSFRLDIYRLIHSGGNMLEGFNIAFAYAMQLRGNLLATIRDNLDEIDDTLWLLIDPQKRDLPLEVLVSQFNYPDADLGEHDRQFMFDTF